MDTCLGAETINLLNFIDLATITVTSALHKTDTRLHSKRRVNHRRYLQKQIKKSRIESRSTGSPSSETGQHDCNSNLTMLPWNDNEPKQSPTTLSIQSLLLHQESSKDYDSGSRDLGDEQQYATDLLCSPGSNNSIKNFGSDVHVHPNGNVKLVKEHRDESLRESRAELVNGPRSTSAITTWADYVPESCWNTSYSMASSFSPQSPDEGSSSSTIVDSNDFLSELTLDYLISDPIKWPDTDNDKGNTTAGCPNISSRLQCAPPSISELDHQWINEDQGDHSQSNFQSPYYLCDSFSTVASPLPQRTEWPTCEKQTFLWAQPQCQQPLMNNCYYEPEADSSVRSHANIQLTSSKCGTQNVTHTESDLGQYLQERWLYSSEYPQNSAYVFSEKQNDQYF